MDKVRCLPTRRLARAERLNFGQGCAGRETTGLLNKSPEGPNGSATYEQGIRSLESTRSVLHTRDRTTAGGPLDRSGNENGHSVCLFVGPLGVELSRSLWGSVRHARPLHPVSGRDMGSLSILPGPL